MHFPNAGGVYRGMQRVDRLAEAFCCVFGVEFRLTEKQHMLVTHTRTHSHTFICQSGLQYRSKVVFRKRWLLNFLIQVVESCKNHTALSELRCRFVLTGRFTRKRGCRRDKTLNLIHVHVRDKGFVLCRMSVWDEMRTVCVCVCMVNLWSGVTASPS